MMKSPRSAFFETLIGKNFKWNGQSIPYFNKYYFPASVITLLGISFFLLNYLQHHEVYLPDNGVMVQLGYLCCIAILLFQVIRVNKKNKQARKNTTDSELKFEKLYDSGIIGLLFVRLDGTVVKANRAFLDIVGYTENDVENGLINWNTLTPDEFKEVTSNCINELKSKGVCTPFEKEYVKKDGRRISVMLASTVLEGHKFADAVTYVIDITDRKNAQDQVIQINQTMTRQKEELLRLLMNAPAMISLRRGEELRLEFMNQASLDYAGSSEHIGLTPQETALKFNVESGTEILERVFQTGQRFNAKAYHLRFDRSGNGEMEDAWFDFVIEPMLDAQGNIDGVASFGFDVSELVKANMEIRESETRFRFLADSLQHKIWTSDPEGKATYYNKGWYDYFNANTFEELNSAIWASIHPDDLAEAKKKWEEAVVSGENLEIEQRFKNAKGIYEWHLTRCCAHKDERGKILLWVGSCTNIHDQKAVQETAELLSKKKDEFLGIASHELKTPITSMKGALQILGNLSDKEFDAQKVRGFVVMANKQVKKLSQIVDELLDVTRIQSGKMELNKTEYVFQDSLKDCLEVMQTLMLGRKVIVTGTRFNIIKADRVRLEQVITNLLSNAIKYSPPESLIEILTEEKDGYLLVSVADQGIGIPESRQKLIFEKFSRAHESHRFSGLGLGLYISSQIVTQHGGEMGVISEVGKGSTFCFTIPVA